MESATNPLGHKEATMFGYTIRINFSDDSYDVVTVDANSIDEALELLGAVEGMTSTLWLGTIDRRPQVCLAW
jgi:hypothetical protein